MLITIADTMQGRAIYSTRKGHRSQGGHLILKCVVVLFLIIATMIFYLWERIVVNQLLRDIQALRQKQEKLKDENKRLGIEIAKLMAFDRIEKVARDSLGMIVPLQEPEILFYHTTTMSISDQDTGSSEAKKYISK